MKKLLCIISLSVMAFMRCTEEQASIDPESLLIITSGFSSSYMSFQITGGLTAVPEYNVLNMTSGLSLNGGSYEATFTNTDTTGSHSVSIVLPSPAEGTAYLEGSANLFSYTRGKTWYTIDTAYSGGNDFRITITDWNGTGSFMQATFSGFVCPGAGDCLTIENGSIKALVK